MTDPPNADPPLALPVDPQELPDPPLALPAEELELSIAPLALPVDAAEPTDAPLAMPVEETGGATRSFGLGAAGVAPPRERTPVAPDVRIPGYDVLEKLGEGGMGVVYKARHQRLNRIVALKMIRVGGHARSEELVRFLAEAEAVALLQHPNIVQVYDTGQHNGLPYFSLEFVAGGNLADRLSDGPLDPAESARILEQLARAVGYAHRQGVVHRDLKPANVLMTLGGELGGGSATQPRGGRSSSMAQSHSALRVPATQPKITDFGLAKRVEGSSGMTQDGAVMGTPSYMAPEQARGDTVAVGPPCDVYALGAVLYTCLTGRPPFQAAAALDVIIQVIQNEPLPPRALNPTIPRDLETICLRCLEKSPAKRYATADDLGDDLLRFLNREPILARPVGPIERTVKWARRRPTAAALVVVSVLAATAVATALTASNIRVNAQYRQTQEALASLEREQDRTRAALAGEQDALRISRQAFDKLTDAEKQTRALLETQERAAYRSGILLADREADAPTTGRLAELLDATPPRLRRWEWFVLDRLARPARFSAPHPGPDDLAWADDGKTLVARDRKEVVRWDATGRELSRTPVPVGGAAAPNGAVAWFDTDGRKLLVRRPDRPDPVTIDLPPAAHSGLTWADGGTHLAVRRNERNFVVWAVADTTRPVAEHDLNPPGELRFGPKGLVRPAAVSAPGTLSVRWGRGGAFATAVERNGKTETLTVWQAEREKPVASLHAADGFDLAATGWNPSGSLFGAVWVHWLAPEGGAGPEAYVRAWDTVRGTELPRMPLGPAGPYAVAWSDGYVAAAPSSDVKTPGVVFRPGGGGPAFRLAEPTPLTTRVVFAAGGELVVTAGPKVRVWQTITGRAVATLEGEDVVLADRPVTARGTRVLGTCRADGGGPPDRVGRVWDAYTGRILLTMKPRDTGFTRLEWSPDGSSIATAEPGLVRAWDLSEATPAPPPGSTPGPDGKSWVGRYTSAHYYLSAGGIAETRTPAGPSYYTGHVGGPVGAVAWAADGKRVATCSGDMTVKIWNPDTGAELRVYRNHKAPPCAAWWAAGDRRVISCSGTGTYANTNELRIWNPDTGADVARLEGYFSPEDVGRRVAVTRDGTRFVTAGLRESTGDDSAVRVWDAETGRMVREFPGVQASRVAVSADGGRVAAVTTAPSDDRRVRVWDTADGRELWATTVSATVAALGISPDGSRLAVADADRVFLFDAATGRPVLADPHPVPGVTWAVFSPDGTRLLLANPALSGQQFAGRTDVLAAGDGRLIRTITPVGDETKMALMHWSPDSKQLGGTVYSKKGPANQQTVLTVNAATGTRTTRATGYHSGFVIMFRWAPDGKRAATASFDRTAKVWNFETGTAVTFGGHAGDLTLTQAPAQDGWGYYRPPYTSSFLQAFAWSPDARLVASVTQPSSGTQGVLRVWEPATGFTVMKVSAASGAQVEFAPDGRHLVVRPQSVPPQVWEVGGGRKVLELAPSTAAVKWSEDGTRVLTVSGPSGARSGQLTTWNLVTGAEGKSIPFTPESGTLSLAARDVAWSRDGRLALATPAGIEMWEGGAKRFTVPGVRAPLAWSRDGRLAAVAADPTSPATVVLAPGKKEAVRVAEVHGPVASLLWTPDGNRLIVGRPGRGPVVCDPATGEALLRLKGPAARLAWANDGRTLLGFDQSLSPAATWVAASPPGP